MHSQTLLIVLLMIVGLMATLAFTAWRLNPNIRGIREWFFGFVAALINLLVFIFKPPITQVLDLLIAQSCLALTGIMACKGVYEFVGKRGFPFRASIITLLLVIASSTYFLLIVPDLMIRFMIGSSASGVFLVIASVVMFRHGGKTFPARTLFACALQFHGLFITLRPLLVRVPSKDLLFVDFAFSASQLILTEQIIMTVLFGLGIIMLVNERISHELKVRADRDSLTNLYNRGAFIGHLSKAISLSFRSRAPLSLLILDLDHFKQINDQFGHLAGDAAIVEFSSIVKRTLRNEDVGARLGGEEFGVLLPNTKLDSAMQLAERLRENVARLVVDPEHDNLRMTVSIGVSSLADSDSVESIIARADRALYKSKAFGRNRVEHEVAV